MESLYVLELAGGKYYVGKSADVIKRFDQHKNGTGCAWTKKHVPIKLLETRPITSPHDENNVTKDLMKKYGVDKVRGGAYTAVDLPEEQEDAIRHELRAAHDTCYKCGKTGHFANQCKRKSSFSGSCGCGRSFLDFDEFLSHNRMCIGRAAAAAKAEETPSCCSRCGRNTHTASSCYAKTHMRGHSLDDESDDESEEETEWQCCECKRVYPSESAAEACRCQTRSRAPASTGACYRCGRRGHYSPDCYASRHVKGYELD
jgi:predicted GIY-YIG superfamily endonuclease